MGGGDQVASLNKFVQFGVEKQMAVGGALFELETLRAVPDNARVGWVDNQWWWEQPTGVPREGIFQRHQATHGKPGKRTKLVRLRVGENGLYNGQ